MEMSLLNLTLPSPLIFHSPGQHYRSPIFDHMFFMWSQRFTISRSRKGHPDQFCV